MPFERASARIGTLHFKYEDPNVDVATESRVVEHDTIDNSIVVQTIGRHPDEITISGVVATYELDIIDDLTKQGEIRLRTERWQGIVVVRSTSTNFRRAIDADGHWLYDVTINCVEVADLTPSRVESTPSETGEVPPGSDEPGFGDFA